MTDLRLLAEGDEAALRTLLMRDPLYNLFMIGDLEMMGMGATELSFWGQFSPGGELAGAAMRYRANWCFYAGAGCDLRLFARLVDDYPKSHVVNGHPDLVDPVVAQLKRYTVQELHASYYCRLKLDTVLPAPAWPTRRATAADVDALVELYATAGIMRRDADNLQRTLDGGKIVVTEAGGRIVSAAMTLAGTTVAAMIGGVFTPEAWRNRGYASAAMTHLCTELLSESKQPCLFYDNPAAGAIYRRLGFEDIGPWNMVLLEPNEQA